MRMQKPWLFFLAFLLVTSLACIGGLSSGKQGGGQPPAQVPQAETGPKGGTSGAAGAAQPMPGSRPARSFQEAENAVVKFIATGSKAMLEAGGQNVLSQWGGSGFLIDPSGIVVTNNHVVTGAATLKAYIAGDIQKEFPARVLGASECLDLAVVQIDGGPFPVYLEWYTGPVTEGMDVYAAGFPVMGDDKQYTLTKGIISRTRDSGETTWSHLEYAYLHDARIRGGNSGGPLITPQGQVVGVNYAGENVKDANYAIPAEIARPAVEKMRQGQNYLWLGMDAQAIVLGGDDGDPFIGIWVASVESGSPADRAGLQPGDIILTIEGLPSSLRGSMKEYCEILASHKPTDVLKVEVFRFKTGEFLAGEFNGRPLQVVDRLEGGQQASGQQSGGQQTGGGQAQGDFTLWTDDLQAIAVAAPSSWQDVDGSPWEIQDAGTAASLIIAPDLQAFNNFQGPGIWVTASEDFAKLLGYVQMLGLFKQYYGQYCKYEARYDYEDEVYRGKFDVWSRCGPSKQVEALVMAVRPKTASDLPEFFMTVVVHVTPNEDAQTLLQAVFDTFDVIGALP